MNTQKTVILIIVGIIAVAISVLIIQLLLKKAKLKAEVNGTLNKSFAIYFSMLFLSTSVIQIKSISILSEAVDNIFKLKIEGAVFEVLKTSSIYTGISSLWFLLWYFVANVFAVISIGKRDDLIEIEKDNYTYFLIKGIILFGTIISLSSIFEMLLKFFIPSIQIPFYH